MDCPKLPNRTDLDAILRETKADDVLVFHQSKFDAKTGERFMEIYDGSFPFVFTTEAIPQTMAESRSRNKSVRAVVKQRNIRRQVGDLTVSEAVRNKLAEVSLLDIKSSGSRISLKLHATEKVGAVSRVILEYRSDIEDIVHEMDFSISEASDGKGAKRLKGARSAKSGSSAKGAKGGFDIDAYMDMSVLKHGCIYWDIWVCAGEPDGAKGSPGAKAAEAAKIGEAAKDEAGAKAAAGAKDASGGELRYPVTLSRSMRKKLRRYFCQCELGEYIAFPHISLTHTLAFTHRERTKFDTREMKLREAAVSAYSLIWRKKNKKRRIWLVFEKFCSAAQDNGFYFFKYCMDELPPEEKKDIYFVIDKSSKDYEKNLRAYDDHVIDFMSFRHLLYAINAKVYVGSDSRKHLYTWRPKPNLISIRMGSVPIHFLQHGVTALKKSGVLFGARGSSPMTHVTVTSEFEQRIIEDYWGYSHANAPILGFTRWDVLEDKSSPDEKLILVMPTWRAWLEEKPDEDFLASDYFRNYMKLLADEALRKCLEENDAKLIFFIHPKFKDYLGKFSAPSERIELVQFGSRPLNEIMMKCSMLVTDYSSVCWDVYYMGKPVVFYQFDYDMYMENHGSYLDMEHELFGDRYTKLDDVTAAIRYNIENGFEESERAKSMRSRYFTYIDKDNSRRTYEFLRSRGY